MLQVLLGEGPLDDALELLVAYLERVCPFKGVMVSRVSGLMAASLKIKHTPIGMRLDASKIESPHALFEQVTEVTKTKSVLMGDDSDQLAQVLSFIHAVQVSKPEDLRKTVNSHLETCTYLVGNHITVADIVVASRLLPVFTRMNSKEKFKFCHAFRWLDHIQHLPVLDEILKSRGQFVTFPSKDDAQEEVKEGKKKGGKGGQKKKADEKPQDPDISQVDIRVGKIEKIWEVEGSSELYGEEINIGGGEMRLIGSGVKNFVKMDILENSLVVVVCNLKPKKLGPITSHGMVLFAHSPDGKQLAPVRPPADSQPGDKVTFPGYPHNPVPQLNPNKGLWDRVQPDFKVEEDGTCVYKDSIFTTPQGKVKAEITGGGIS